MAMTLNAKTSDNSSGSGSGGSSVGASITDTSIIPGDIVGVIDSKNYSLVHEWLKAKKLKLAECNKIFEIFATNQFLQKLLIDKPDVILIQLPQNAKQELWRNLCTVLI